MRDHNSLDQCGIAGILLDSACILKIEATTFDDELNIGWKEGEDPRMMLKFLIEKFSG